MYVKFNKLKFKNFLSYGNGWTVLEFNPRLNIISAKNGSGKSAIIDAISFVLFGKPYREIKMKNLINQVNKKHLEVEIEFEIENDKYKILRGLGPKKFEFTKNGETVDVLSSQKLNQIEIDKILGVKYLLFKNVMCIGAISNVPFFNMCLSDRRELFETIFGLGTISDMLDEVKLRNSNNKIEFKTNTAAKEGLKSNIADTEKFIEEMKKHASIFEEMRCERIKKIEDHIDELQSEVMRYVKNITVCDDQIDQLTGTFNDLDDLKKQEEDLKAKIMKVDARTDSLNTQLKNREKGICPICGTDLCSGHAAEYFNALDGDVRKLSDARAKLTEKLNIISEEVKDRTGKKALLEKAESIKSQIKVKRDSLLNSIDYDNDQINNIREEKSDFDTSKHEDQLDSYQRQYKIVNDKLTEIEEQMAIDADLQTILSDSGIKKYFFNEIVPVLNQKVNAYIKKFGLPHEVIFDEMLEYTITKGAFEMEYNQLSNGEKTRVNVAMLLTFYDIARQMSNWSCSILFLDEIFDSGIDSDGLSSFLTEMVTMLRDDRDLGVYLISHKLDELNLRNIEYDDMRIVMNGVFSKIIKV